MTCRTCLRGRRFSRVGRVLCLALSKENPWMDPAGWCVLHRGECNCRQEDLSEEKE